MPIEPLMAGEETRTQKPDGTIITKRKWNIEPEDILAIGGVLVALLVVGGMIFGKLPINQYTYGLAGFSAAGAGIAKIVKVRRSTSETKK